MAQLSIGLLPQFLTDVSIPPVYFIGGIYLALLLAGVLVDLMLLGRFLTVPFPWNDMLARLKSRPWRGRDVLWLVFLLLLAQAGAGGIYWLGVKRGLLAPAQSETQDALLQGALFHGLALLLVCVFIRNKKSSWDFSFGMSWRGLKSAAAQGVTGYVGLLPVLMVTSLLYQFFLYAAGQTVTLQDVVAIFLEEQSAGRLFFLMALAVVIAPLVEEILFRGMVVPVLLKKVGPGAGVALSSFFFAVIHQHLPSLAPLFVLAVALSLLYVYSGSLWPAIILHSIFNGVSIGVLLLVAT